MSIEKGLYQAPQGIAGLDEAEPISVEIVDPEEVNIEGPGFEMHIEKADTPQFNANLAEQIGDAQLQSLAANLLADYDDDLSSRKEWIDTYVKGLKLLGLKYEERAEPWPGASGVFHPMLMEAGVKFQSDLIMETFPSAGPVRTKIIGKETPEKKEAASRVQEDMNYQLTEVMQEYRPEHERMLLCTSFSGNAFKKIYFDPALDRQVAPFIPPEDVIVPYGAANLESAERITHRMRKTPNELRRLQVAGFYRDIDLGDPVQIMDEVEKQKAQGQGFSASMDSRFQLLEMHVDLDLEGFEDKDDNDEPTGIKLPYVVTIEKGTAEVLAIRRNWLENDPLKARRQHFIHYGYIPGFGFYYFGLIHLIGGHTHAATSLMRQLIDAGTLSNLPGGLKARGLRVKGDDTPIAPGEFRDVDLPSGAIRDNILPLPYKEPSQVLMALMDKIVMDGRQFAATAELNVSDMSAQAPVGTTLAILERVMKVMSAVQARIHYAMKQEFKLLAGIIRDNTPESYSYEPDVGSAGAKRSDYDCCDVIPVSDPNASTMAQRVVQYQAVMQLAQQAPQLYDLPYLHRQMIEVLGVKNANKIVPLKDDQKPLDPVSENMAIMTGKPVKAFIHQDHKAHLAVHQAAMQDPKLAAMMGQNPQAQAIMAAAQAHLMEHLAFEYRAQVQETLGALLPPPPNEEDDSGFLLPEDEIKVSQLAAMAAQQLLQKNQAEAQQQRIQQQQQDPIIQMQQQELQLKERDLQLKEQVAKAEIELENKRLLMEATAKHDELELRQNELDRRNNLEGVKIGGDATKHKDEMKSRALKMMMDAAKSEDDMRAKGIQMGIDVAKDKAAKDIQHKQMVRDSLHRHASLDHQTAQKDADRKYQAEQSRQPAQPPEETE